VRRCRAADSPGKFIRQGREWAAGAADTTVDVVAELKALGYDFREVTAP
jgi:hypothetical protein